MSRSNYQPIQSSASGEKYGASEGMMMAPGAASGGGGAGVGLIGAGGGLTKAGSGNGTSDGYHDHPSTLDQHRKPWYLRRRAIYTLIALLLVLVAVAVGLGVGISQKKKEHDSSRTAVTSPDGTVIPSSYGSLTSTTRRPRSSSTAAAAAATATPTPSASDPSAPTPTASAEGTAGAADGDDSDATVAGTAATDPITYLTTSATVRASTGNLPIPVDVETTISGVVYSSLPDESITARRASATAVPRRVRLLR